MKKIIFISALVLSANSFAQQSLQCQLEREQLVAEYRQKQNREQQAIEEAKLTPFQQGQLNMQRGMNRIAESVAQGGQTLEQRIKDWESRCGR